MFDMSQALLAKPTEAALSSGYAGLSFIVFRPVSLSRVFGHNDDNRLHPDSSDSAKTDPSQKREPYHILMVDDERDITMVFKGALERAGFKVDVFNDPLAALSHFKPDYYDLALLDIRMPGMSGFELYSQITKKDKKLKACFISAFEVLREELKKYAPEKDEECVIKKPVSTRDLIKVIKEELE